MGNYVSQFSGNDIDNLLRKINNTSIATPTKPGYVMPVVKDYTMIQPVGIDIEGKLFTEASKISETYYLLTLDGVPICKSVPISSEKYNKINGTDCYIAFGSSLNGNVISDIHSVTQYNIDSNNSFICENGVGSYIPTSDNFIAYINQNGSVGSTWKFDASTGITFNLTSEAALSTSGGWLSFTFQKEPGANAFSYSETSYCVLFRKESDNTISVTFWNGSSETARTYTNIPVVGIHKLAIKEYNNLKFILDPYIKDTCVADITTNDQSVSSIVLPFNRGLAKTLRSAVALLFEIRLHGAQYEVTNYHLNLDIRLNTTYNGITSDTQLMSTNIEIPYSSVTGGGTYGILWMGDMFNSYQFISTNDTTKILGSRETKLLSDLESVQIQITEGILNGGYVSITSNEILPQGSTFRLIARGEVR